MDANTRQDIIHYYVEPLIVNTSVRVSVHRGRIIIKDDKGLPSWLDFIADILPQVLGAKGYDVDVYKEGDTVIIDDAEIEEE